MLIINEGGTTYWRALDCVSTCSVSNSPVKAATGSELALHSNKALAGVVELNGHAATNHLQISVERSLSWRGGNAACAAATTWSCVSMLLTAFAQSDCR